MKITIEPTALLTRLDGVRVRMWEGVTDDGIAVKVFVHRLAVAREADTSSFEQRLEEQIPPGVTVPLTMLL